MVMICPYCGAHLDPGERCDCPETKKELSYLLPDQKHKKSGDACQHRRNPLKKGEKN